MHEGAETTMGKVYLVGAGPGDPELITVKGLTCIQRADVILYDRLINEELLSYAKPDAELIFCGKLPGCHAMQQETINRALVLHAKKGKTVVRLKGGDPFVFGRGGEEAEALVKHGIEFEIVPGVTSAIAAAAYAGIPVTHREFSSSVAFVTGHRREGSGDEIQWESLAKGIDTIAIYMGIQRLSSICSQLMKYGKSPETPAAVIEWGTTSAQRTVTGTLATIAEIAANEQMRNPSMVIIGEVVRLRANIQWYERLLWSSATAGATS